MSSESEQDSVYQYSHLPLNERLKKYWQKGMYPIFWGTVYDEVVPGLCTYLLGKFQLTYEDSEDCISEALEGLAAYQEEPARVEYPRRFIWQSAINSAIDLIIERTKETNACQKLRCETVTNRGKRSNKTIIDDRDNINQDVDVLPDQELGRPSVDCVDNITPVLLQGQSPTETELTSKSEPSEGIPTEHVTYTEEMSEVEIPGESATYIIEGLLEGIDAEVPWAVRVIAKALTQLTPAERKVTESILRFGPDYKAPEAQGDIGISATAFRQYKKRAYKKLREIIPQIMEDMGITFRRQPESDIFVQKPTEFPSEEERLNDAIGEQGVNL